MGLLDLFRQITGRGYLPRVAAQHVAAPYEKAGASASYSHVSGYITLPVSYTEGNSYSSDTTSVVAVRVHKPITTKTLSYDNQRHGLLPEVLEPQPGQYLRPQDSSVVVGSSRNVSAPEFGALESHGAAWNASGNTSIVFLDQEPFSVKAGEKVPQNSYDGTDATLVPSLSQYPRRTI